MNLSKNVFDTFGSLGFPMSTCRLFDFCSPRYSNFRLLLFSFFYFCGTGIRLSKLCKFMKISQRNSSDPLFLTKCVLMFGMMFGLSSWGSCLLHLHTTQFHQKCPHFSLAGALRLTTVYPLTLNLVRRFLCCALGKVCLVTEPQLGVGVKGYSLGGVSKQL